MEVKKQFVTTLRYLTNNTSNLLFCIRFTVDSFQNFIKERLQNFHKQQSIFSDLIASRLLINFLNLVSEFTGSSVLITIITNSERPIQKQITHKLHFFQACKFVPFKIFRQENNNQIVLVKQEVYLHVMYKTLKRLTHSSIHCTLNFSIE